MQKKCRVYKQKGKVHKTLAFIEEQEDLKLTYYFFFFYSRGKIFGLL